MKLKFLVALLPMAVALPATAEIAAAESSMCGAPATQLARGKGLGSYIRCYQREFAACIRELREQRNTGIAGHQTCRGTARKACERHQYLRREQQRHRG